MDITNFQDHLQSEIQNKPYENLNNIVLEDGVYYYSPKGSSKNGVYEWDSLADESFRIATLEELRGDKDFMDSVFDVFKTLPSETKSKLNGADLNVILREIMDETLGFGLPFTLLDAASFSKELEYYNVKNK